MVHFNLTERVIQWLALLEHNPYAYRCNWQFREKQQRQDKSHGVEKFFIKKKKYIFLCNTTTKLFQDGSFSKNVRILMFLEMVLAGSESPNRRSDYIYCIYQDCYICLT